MHTEYQLSDIFSFQASKKPLSILQSLGKEKKKKAVEVFFPLSIGAKIPHYIVFALLPACAE